MWCTYDVNMSKGCSDGDQNGEGEMREEGEREGGLKHLLGTRFAFLASLLYVLLYKTEERDCIRTCGMYVSCVYMYVLCVCVHVCIMCVCMCMHVNT